MADSASRRRRAIIIAAIILLIGQYTQLITNTVILFEKNNVRLIRRRCRNKTLSISVFSIANISNLNVTQFQSHFRMTPVAFHHLERLSAPKLKNFGVGRNMVYPRKQILCTIWLLATPDSYRSIADRFNMEKSTLYYCALRVVKTLCSFAQKVIKWPRLGEILDIKQRFRRAYKFPDIVGAVDGSYIFINKPKENGSDYNTRKCRYAIVLQAICEFNLKFLDCFAGYPGSVGDFRIFRNSDIYKDINDNESLFFPNNEHLLGDKAYPLKNWCITPYRDNGRLTEEQRYFNTVHAKSRSVIERAFGLLKGRFRRLKYMEVIRVDLVPFYILASCVLHNICIDVGGEDVDMYIDHDIEQNDFEENFQRNEENSVQHDNAGRLKREYLCTMINEHL